MAEKKATAKAPTKQDIQKELDETKNALKDAMDLIAQMKEQMKQQPQVTVVNTTEKRPNAKLKCINLYHGHLNVSTRPDGRGRVYEFKEYGQVQYIKYDDMLDIISSYPNTMASGLLYIADKDFCDEQNVYEDMDKVYTKEMLDKEEYDAIIIAVGSEPIVPNLPGIDKPHVHWAPDAELGKVSVGEKIVVIGAGAVGIEAALDYKEQGKDVLIDIRESGANAGTVFTPRPYDHNEMSVEEAAMGTIRLEGNFLVNFKFTWALNYPTSNSFVLCGPEGGIDAKTFKLYKNVGHYQAETDLKYFNNRKYNYVSAFPGHWYMYEHVLNVIEGTEERLVKPEETLNVVASIECFYRSAAEGREVRATELEGYDL